MQKNVLLKNIVFIVFLLLISNVVFAQTDTIIKDTSKKHSKDTGKKNIKPIVKPKVSTDTSITKDTSKKYIQPAKVSKPLVDTTVNAIDSLTLSDSTKNINQDSINNTKIMPLVKDIDTSTFESIVASKYFPLKGNKIFMVSSKMQTKNKDYLFYLLLGVVLIVAFIKVSFPKYFTDIFKILYQSTYKQKQTRDQLLQDSLPSLFMNISFFICTGVFITLLVQHFNLLQINFWIILLYCTGLLVAIYFIKYIFLLFSGWVFNMQQIIGSYTFIIFLINKMIGVILIPILFVLAFSLPKIATTSITVALVLIGVLFLYRYWLGYKAIRNTVKISAIHFFLYLCAFEVLPIALLYKAVFNYIKV